MSNYGIGDIKVSALKIGSIDLTSFNQATYDSFEIYEDILSPHGAVSSINVIDHSDILGSNPQVMNGSYDQDVEIKFSLAASGGEEVGFKFKMLRNKNLIDGGEEKRGSGHSKRYQIRCCSPELLNAQGNYIQKNYKEQTSKIVEDIYKNGFKTKKEFEVKDETKGQLKYNINRKHPAEALKSLQQLHVSAQNESSLYVTFERSENGNQKFIFTTFEQLFQESPVATLKQSTVLDSSKSNTQDRANAIIKLRIPDSFYTPSRPLTKTSKTSYNVVTGVQQTDPADKEPKFKYADSSPTFQQVNHASSKKDTQIPSRTVIDPSNDKERTGIAEAKAKRAAFLAHLSQNYGKIEIIGNPKIKLGSMVNLEIFKKADDSKGGESQFNGKALVVSIKHTVNPIGQSPRYVMELGVVKASYKEGGGNNG